MSALDSHFNEVYGITCAYGTVPRYTVQGAYRTSAESAPYRDCARACYRVWSAAIAMTWRTMRKCCVPASGGDENCDGLATRRVAG